MYFCPRCNYETNKKPCMRNHFKRKNACDILYEEISIEKCKEMLIKGLLKKIKIKPNHECIYCNKHFDRIERLNNHVIKCKKKEKIFDLFEKQQEEIENLKKELKNNVGNTTNNTTNNTVNNYGNTFNINISSFKDTNYMALKDEIIQCLENQDPLLKVPAFEKIIDAVHFNKDYPENHNIYKPNVREDRILTFDGKEFLVEKTAVDTILEKLEQILDQCIDKDKGKEYLEKLKHHLKLKQTDRDYSEATKDDIAVSLYNGKNIVKNTHKDLKKQEIKA